MSLRSAVVWGNASWREAVRMREAFVDVDHLLLGLAASGGPAARLLARHGLTLATGRRAARDVDANALGSLGVDVDALAPVPPRPADELHHRAAGHAPMTPRADRLCRALPRRSTERDYLTALLAEPSRTAHEVLQRAGVDVGALTRDLAASTTRWRTPTTVRVASSTPGRRGRCVSSLRLEHWTSAPRHLVHHAATDLETTSRWLSSPDSGLTAVDGRHETRVDTGRAGGPLDLVLTAATAERVRWEMWWGQRYGGSYTLDLTEDENGTLIGLNREITTFGHLGAPMMPATRFATGLGLPTLVQNLSFACADLIEEERW